MSTVDMRDAKTHLSKLVGDVESGAVDEVVIARNGKPAAKLVPIDKAKGAGKRLGLLKGRFPAMSLDDFNADDEAIAAYGSMVLGW